MGMRLHTSRSVSIVLLSVLLTLPLTAARYDRDGADLANGLFVDLEPWQFHLFLVETIRD
jgi:hypothetical protein